MSRRTLLGGLTAIAAAPLAQAAPDYDADKNQGRMIEVIAGPLADAQARGVMDPGLTGDDILMACWMLASHRRLDGEPDLAGVFEKRFALMMRGLEAREA